MLLRLNLSGEKWNYANLTVCECLYAFTWNSDANRPASGRLVDAKFESASPDGDVDGLHVDTLERGVLLHGHQHVRAGGFFRS